MTDRFPADYYERGRELGLSWYQRFRWMPERSRAEAAAVLAHFGLGPGAPVLDWGCAKGFLVRALCEAGADAWGVEVSRYALSAAEEPWRRRLCHVDDTWALPWCEAGVCKDVLEHCRDAHELGDTLARMADAAGRWLVVVPLATGGAYRHPEYEYDVTHELRYNEAQWAAALGRRFEIDRLAYRMPGLKDHWAARCANGNLFFTLTPRRHP